MRLIRSIARMQRISRALKTERKTIGFVPTMGYLHAGHCSLARKSAAECDVTVMSIYVNPLQFGPKEDFKKYPRDLKRDAALARKNGVDYLFVPADSQMYPDPYRRRGPAGHRLKNMLTSYQKTVMVTCIKRHKDVLNNEAIEAKDEGVFSLRKERSFF